MSIGVSHADRLGRVVEAIASNNTAGAEAHVAELFAAIGDQVAPESVGYYVFGAALARRLSPAVAEQANLYLSQFDVPQIRLFDLLATQVPQVALTTVIANRCIARALRGSSHATLIDVGIGTGRQITSLLTLLHDEGQLPERLTLIGIEPAEWCIAVAQQNVSELAAKLGVELDFHAFSSPIEHLDQQAWAALARLCPTRPVINGSFAFHHISDIDGRDVRDDVFLRLRSLDPVALVLSEPDVNHHEPDFSRRFTNSWRHFETTFRVIDGLPITQVDKDALKVNFFGREIADILGNPEGTRSERHETSASWLRRLRATGFEPELEVDLPASGLVIGVAARGDHATLEYRGESLVAVLASKAAKGPFDIEGALARAPRAVGE